MAEQGAEVIERISQIGDGAATKLDHPLSNSFGEFATATRFDLGCRPIDVVENDGVVMFQSENPDRSVTRDITIGKTPDGLDTEGPEWEQAGEKGEYLLHMRTVRFENAEDEPKEYEQYFYFDKKDLQDVVIEKEKIIVLPKRGQILPIQGKVHDVLALNI